MLKIKHLFGWSLMPGSPRVSRSDPDYRLRVLQLKCLVGKKNETKTKKKHPKINFNKVPILCKTHYVSHNNMCLYPFNTPSQVFTEDMLFIG